MIEKVIVIQKVRRELDLAWAEYALCDMIYHKSLKQWATISRTDLAIEMGLTKRAVIFMIDRMIEQGLIERNDETKQLRTTDKWQLAVNP